MKELFLYTNDYKYNVRDTECSRTVVNSWFDECVRYAEEKISDHGCLKLVAERLVVRHLLGMKNLDAWDLNCVARIQPFGDDGPLVAELMLPNVFCAMAFFPLTPANTKGNPILARLYCVKGLPNSYNTLPLEGMSEVASPEVSWFLEGVPKEELKKGIRGRSWLLAAHLLRQVVNMRSLSTARNLMKHYIVTGDVRDGLICPVEIGRKAELFEKFEGFKWIIPKENEMNLPKRKTEKPATLKEAYELIESMQNCATRTLFSSLRTGSLDVAKMQYEKCGADIYALEEGTGLSSLEVIARTIEEVRKKELCTDEELNKLYDIMGWLKQNNADCAMMFYQIAQIGDKTLLESCKRSYEINAVDENGLTAVDWALNVENWTAANLLHSVGGSCNNRLGANKKITQAIEGCLCDPDPNPHSLETRKYGDLVAWAIDCGLDPRIVVSKEKIGAVLCRDMIDNSYRCFDWRDSPDFDHSVWRGCKDVEATIKGTLWGLAIYRANLPIIAACLRNGIGVDSSSLVSLGCKEITSFMQPASGNYLIMRIKEKMKGVAYKEDKENYEEIIKLLKNHGFPEEYQMEIPDDIDREL